MADNMQPALRNEVQVEDEKSELEKLKDTLRRAKEKQRQTQLATGVGKIASQYIESMGGGPAAKGVYEGLEKQAAEDVVSAQAPVMMAEQEQRRARELAGVQAVKGKEAEKKSAKEQRKDEMALGKEYRQNPSTKRTAQVREAYEKVKSSASDPSAAGDLSLIFNYMKMLDPGSVVREGEFATAQNAAGVPDMIRNQWNRLVSGERLNPNQRKDFSKQAQNTYRAQLTAQKSIYDQYKDAARRYGFDPKRMLGSWQEAQKIKSPKGAQPQAPVAVQPAESAPPTGIAAPEESRSLGDVFLESIGLGGGSPKVPEAPQPKAAPHGQRVKQNGVTYIWNGSEYVEEGK